jgi:predicted DNA-binding protein
MANPFFSGRIPKDLNEKINSFTKESGKSRSEILIEALSAYLNYPVEIKKPAHNEELWDAIRKLQERVAALEGADQELIVIQGDNNFDNETNGNNHSQLSLLEEIPNNDKKENESLSGKIIKTNEVPALPGLENENATEIKTQLRNARSRGKTPIKIGDYLLDTAGKEPGLKGTLLWKIISDNL